MSDPAAAPTISVCIVCRNEAAKLRACLESAVWADEILVMDLRSVDGSADVARELGADVVERDPHPIVEPLRNELAARARGTWILALDPDERVTPGLASTLREIAARTDVDAVYIPFMNFDFGWAPESPLQRYEPHLRMYRAGAVRWPDFPNSMPQVAEERIVRLPSRDDLVIEHRRNVNVAETADRLVRYAPAEAQGMIDRGQAFSVAAMFSDLRKTFFRHVVEARAWEEGMPGIARATVLVNHKVYVWIAFWQQSGAPRTEDDDARVARLGRVLRAVGAARQVRARIRRPRERVSDAFPRWLVLSPHLDDAVLSIGAGISAHVRAGGSVTVATLLSGDHGSTRPAGPWDSASGFATEGDAARARRAEDEAACRILGARPVHLDGTDEQYGVAHGESALWASVCDLAAAHDVVLMPGSPLAHADHRRLAARALDELPGVSLRVYGEEPYLLYQRSPPTEVALPDGRAIRWRRVSATRADVFRKLRAVRCYRSQLDHLARPVGRGPFRSSTWWLLAHLYTRTRRGEWLGAPA